MGDTPLGPKLYWRYLGFYFDHTLSFREHIRYYTMKAMTMVRALGMLGNSNRGVLVMHKCLLYCTCMVPVATYGLQLWYLQGAKLKGTIKQLSAVQRLAALWITGCFRTSPTGGTEALAGLLPMYILLKKLVECSCAHTATLGHSHCVRSVLELSLVGLDPAVSLGLGSLSLAIKCHLISPVKDAVGGCAEFTETFQVLHPEVEPGNRVMDLFSDCIVRHLAPKMSDDRYGDYIKQLDAVLLMVQCDAPVLIKGALQVSLAALVYQGNAKIAHIMVVGGQVMAPNAELMALEMSIATALVAGCSSLVCFMDSTVAMANLVDPSPHLGQGSFLVACTALWGWFRGDHCCVLHLWHVPSREEWKIHHNAHKAAKAAQIPLCPGYRVLFDFIWAAKEMAYWKE